MPIINGRTHMDGNVVSVKYVVQGKDIDGNWRFLFLHSFGSIDEAKKEMEEYVVVSKNNPNMKWEGFRIVKKTIEVVG